MASAKRLREIDLNLLPVLRSLLDTRSVARTAAALALTPSAVSHALARLRTTLGDELFVRSSTGLIATRRATTLADELAAGLATLERVLGGGGFEPREAAITFRVATTDFGARLVLPKLLAALAAAAPGIQVVIQRLPIDTEDALASGEVDVMIGSYPGGATSIYRRLLFSEHTAVLARRGHPRIRRGKLSLDDYLAASHILIAPRGRAGSRIDRLLADQGHARRIALMIPEFMLGPYIVSETEHLLTAGARLLHSFAGPLPVQVVATPFLLPPFDVHLVWHARLHDDAAFAWFRNLLIEIHDQVFHAAEPRRASRRAG
jgi:DNA-binding transcriptional LysR family regulator